MSTLRDAMSHAALGWVKPELDETLRQARSEIEYFVEDPADASRMRFCAGYLHQVQGTLRMVELYAPAMVAEELELLADAVRDGAVPDRDEACATLMRGTVLLPDYLERLQNGHRDIPIVLLPLLNDLRAARGAAGLNESVLFAPDLSRPLPEQVPEASPLPWTQRHDRLAAIALGELDHDRALQRAPHVEHVVQVARRRAGHEGAPVGAQLDHHLLVQPHQHLADARAVGAEGLRQALLAQLHAGQQPALADGRVDALVDFLVGEGSGHGEEGAELAMAPIVGEQVAGAAGAGAKKSGPRPLVALPRSPAGSGPHHNCHQDDDLALNPRARYSLLG